MLHILTGFTNLAEETLKDQKQYIPALPRIARNVALGSEVIIRLNYSGISPGTSENGQNTTLTNLPGNGRLTPVSGRFIIGCFHLIPQLSLSGQ
jgi:hypothetical protein